MRFSSLTASAPLNRFMGTRPQGRAVAFPVVWGKVESHASTSSKSAELGSPNDEELMAEMQRAEPAALAVLFERYSRLVMGIALRILGDYGEAEDAVQETFACLYQKAGLFHGSRG